MSHTEARAGGACQTASKSLQLWYHAGVFEGETAQVCTAQGIRPAHNILRIILHLQHQRCFANHCDPA